MKSLLSQGIFAGSVSAVYVLLILVPPGFAATEKGWKLYQKSRAGGKIFVTIAASGVKLSNPKASYTVVMKKPDYRVYLFSDARKLIYDCPLDKWEGGLGNNFTQLTKDRFGDLSRVVPRATREFDGLKAHRFHMVRSQKTAMATAAEMRGAFNVDSATYSVTYDLPVPQVVCRAVQRFYHVPDTKGFPLNMIHRKVSGKKVEDLKTISCEKSEIATGTFKVPTGYKRVKKDSDVILNDAQIGEMVNEMLGN